MRGCRHDPDAIGRAFVQGVRMVMIVAMPFYMGLAATAEPLVLTVLGDKWRETAPIVHLLALAMPFMTLQMLFTPASDARGRPGIGVAERRGRCADPDQRIPGRRAMGPDRHGRRVDHGLSALSGDQRLADAAGDRRSRARRGARGRIAGTGGDRDGADRRRWSIARCHRSTRTGGWRCSWRSARRSMRRGC